jgi:hypothetical protein
MDGWLDWLLVRWIDGMDWTGMDYTGWMCMCCFLRAHSLGEFQHCFNLEHCVESWRKRGRSFVSDRSCFAYCHFHTRLTTALISVVHLQCFFPNRESEIKEIIKIGKLISLNLLCISRFLLFQIIPPPLPGNFTSTRYIHFHACHLGKQIGTWRDARVCTVIQQNFFPCN